MEAKTSGSRRNILARKEHYLEEIRPKLNESQLRGKIERMIAADTVRKWCSHYEFLGLDQLDQNKQYVLFSNHVSHLDYIVHWLAWHSHWRQTNQVKPLMFAAGKNLDSLLLKTIDLDFGRYGAFFIDRRFISSNGTTREDKVAYDRALQEIVHEQFHLGRNLLVYPGGTRREKKFLSPPIKEKRNKAGEKTYTEEEKKRKVQQEVKNWFFNLLGRSQGLEKIEIVPVGIAYDNRVEDSVLPLIKFISKYKNPLARLTYYALDGATYGIEYTKGVMAISPVHRQIVTSFGKPIPLGEVMNSETEDKTKSERIKSVVAWGIREEYQKAVHTLNDIRER